MYPTFHYALLIILLTTITWTCQAYRVHQVASLLDEETFLPHIKRVLKSQDHRTIFVRFFLHGEGDRTHATWEHVSLHSMPICPFILQMSLISVCLLSSSYYPGKSSF